MSPARIHQVPEHADSLGREALELAANAGLTALPWQADVIDASLGLRGDGRWASTEIGLTVARQNGKGGVFEIRALAGLFLIPGDRLQVYTAHLFKTAGDMQLRLEGLIRSTPDLHSQVKSYKHSHGEEGIYLRNGKRLLFATRSKGGLRGLSIDTLYFDEDMFLPEHDLAASVFTQSARPNPQRWYLGSAVDQLAHPDGVAKSRIRAKAIAGVDPSTAYFEWSVDLDSPDDLTDEMMRDHNLWLAANPSIGHFLNEEAVAAEMNLLPRTFAVERLSIGDWHPIGDQALSDIDLEAWDEAADTASKPLDPVCFAFDVTPRRSFASIAVAGRRSDGLVHVEVIDRRAGTAWVPERLLELQGRHKTASVGYAMSSPAEALIPDLKVRNLHPISTAEHASACGRLFDAVEQRTIRHLGPGSAFGTDLDVAVRGAVQKEHGDRFLWSRSKSSVDISPLVAVTLALYELSLTPERSGPMVAFA
jgi:hypothetical protein